MNTDRRIDRKPRIFLSYGRKDATELALRLRDDLSTHFDVWQDSKKIRAGYRWDEEVAAGIERADAFIALLTPHAVRSEVDSADGRTSVCLDEIAHARSNETPIMPVKAAHCGVPFHIQRLHYLDGRE